MKTRTLLVIAALMLAAAAPALAQSTWDETMDKAIELKNAGKYQEALTIFLWAEEIAIENYGRNSFEFAISAHRLGGIYENLDDTRLAIEHYEQCIDAFERIGWFEYAEGYATSLNNLGALYYTMGRYEEAEPALHQGDGDT